MLGQHTVAVANPGGLLHLQRDRIRPQITSCSKGQGTHPHMSIDWHVLQLVWLPPTCMFLKVQLQTLLCVLAVCTKQRFLVQLAVRNQLCGTQSLPSTSAWTEEIRR